MATSGRRTDRAPSGSSEAIGRRMSALLVDTALRSLSTVGRLHPAARPLWDGIEVLCDLPYRPGSDDPAHRLDVYRPAVGHGPWPIVVYFHGGGFRILSKDTHWLMALQFARAGYLVFNVSYRLAPRHPFPAGLTDAMSAYAWVLDRGRAFGGDIERIAVAGESAGANLSLGVTLACVQPRPEPWAGELFARGRVPVACLPACGLLQVSEYERFSTAVPDLPRYVRDRLASITGAYLGVPGARSDLQWALADPLLVLEGDAPFERPWPACLVTCGTADPVVDDSRRLEAALRKRGLSCEARYYEGEHHAFHALVWRDAARQCWADTHAFLGRAFA